MKSKHSKSLLVCAVTYMLLVSTILTFASDTPPATSWSLSGSGIGSSALSVYEGRNAVTINFPAQASPPSPVVCDLLIGAANPDSVFTGNLLAAGYSGIRFRIAGNGTVPDVLSLVIHQIEGENTREWVFSSITASRTPGEWIVTLIPLEREKGWTTSFRSTKRSKDLLWETDISAVQAMLLRIVPYGTEAQSYSISDLQLTGPGVISEPAQLTPLQAYFEVASADQLTAEMLKQDSDGDGMSDYQEILAGLNPYDASSVLAARVAKSDDKNSISWEGVMGGRYGVMRSNDLLKGFELIASGRVCGYTGEVMTYDDQNPVIDKPNYYKVVKY